MNIDHIKERFAALRLAVDSSPTLSRAEKEHLLLTIAAIEGYVL